MAAALYNPIFYLSVVSGFIPFILIATKINRQPIEYKWLAVVLLFSFLCDAATEILYALFKINVNIISTTFIIVNPLLLSIFFYHCLNWKAARTPLFIVNALFLLFSAFNLLYMQKGNINSYSAVLEKLLIMGFSITYFYKLLREMPAQKIYSIGLFWIISGMFIVHSAKLVLFSFAYYLVIFKDNLYILFNVHNSLSVVCNIIILVGVLIDGRSHGMVINQHD
jgi:hypothetical protein